MINNDRPIIGISSTIQNNKKNIPCIHAHEKYVQSVVRAGGIPVVIPILPLDMAAVLVSKCDGFILSSGEDIDPLSYQANPSPQIQKTNRKRDKIEIELIHQAKTQKKPILAICRGVTMLNVALGGTVIQDIETTVPNAINHYQKAERPEPTHEVSINCNSRLFEILQQEAIYVNSMHHQAIDVLAPTLKVVATAPDGVIEAVEGTNNLTVTWGVQWHPEEMATEDPKMVNLFKAFVSECLT